MIALHFLFEMVSWLVTSPFTTECNDGTYDKMEIQALAEKL
jgi:hypothetical protein